MPLAAGARVGPYEVIAPVGAGGMGEVYRARDTKLGRHVALKVLPGALAGDPDYMSRFHREAQLLAALNHPNIAAIHGLEDDAIVMEFVDGATLAERLARGQLPLGEALDIARQIAEALEYAHEKGVTHRDLKPSNLKITPEGVVKVLDFGLAKLAEAKAPQGNPETSPTLTMRTQLGVILGTAAYMAPEQAVGRPVDRRADIWSFGVVLWEMLTSRRLFAGETISHTLADVLRANIDFGALPATTPAGVRELVERCLDRELKTRLQWIGEARVALHRVLADPRESAPAAPVVRTSRLPWALFAAAALALCAAAAGWWSAARPAAQPLARFDVDMGEGFSVLGIDAPHVILSPDGKRVVSQLRGADGRVRLAVRALDQAKPVPLVGTEGASHQFFSPDGQWIGYFAAGALHKIPSRGGAPATLCPTPTIRGASWGDDGNIIAALEQAGPLSRVPSSGGTPQLVTHLDAAKGERSHRYPQVLPGSKVAIFFSSSFGGSYDNGIIEAVSLTTGQRTVIQQGGYFARYLPSGHLLFMRQDTLFAAPMDLGRLKLSGQPVPLITDVLCHPARGSADFDFAQDGSLLYVPGDPTTTNYSLSSLDAAGRLEPFLETPREYLSPSFSPDGRRLAVSTLDGGKRDIWLYETGRGTNTRLTFLPGEHFQPVWSPDGERIVFDSRDGLYWTRADGASDPLRLTETKQSQRPGSFSPDGKLLAYDEETPGSSLDIWILPVDEKGANPRTFLKTPFREWSPCFSPDGRWLAYLSDESGTQELYVRAYPGPGGKWQISNGGASAPQWPRKGNELFYAFAGNLMAVTYKAEGGAFTASKPRVWTTRHRLRRIEYALAPDGKRLVAPLASVNEEPPAAPTRAVFLLNFFDELKRKVR